MLYNPMAYVREAGGPGELEKHVSNIQHSGLVTVILGMLHFGYPEKDPTMQLGDFIYNNYPADLIVRGGEFNPKTRQYPNGNPVMADWPKQVARLKQNGSVDTVLLSVGSPPEYWPDFATIQRMFETGKTDLLKRSIAALRTAFTVGGVCVLDGFDIDCEEFDVLPPSPEIIVKFCEIVFEQGFQVTFCPYGSRDKWQDCMKTLWGQGKKVSWWNLQCYSGGSDNRNHLTAWIKALSAVVYPQAPASFLVPGLAVKSAEDVPPDDRQCPTGPDSFLTTFTGWNNLHLTGGFLWKYDALVNNPNLCSGQNYLSAYVQAINDALDNKSA